MQLLSYAVCVIDVENACNYTQDSESRITTLGNLQQNYFYLASKFAKIALKMPPKSIPPRIEIAQCIRMQLLIALREHQYVPSSFIMCMQFPNNLRNIGH